VVGATVKFYMTGHDWTTPSRIRRVEFAALELSLHEPFAIAGGAQASAANVLVTVTLADGTLGFGEGAPLPAYNGETQAGTLAALGVAGPRIEGMDARAWRSVSSALRELIAPAGAARCALEMAVLDAVLKQHGMAMSTFFGGKAEPLETDVTITMGSVEHAARAVERWKGVGFRKFKLKVGSADPELDAMRVVAAARACPGAIITLDANASLSSAVAIEMLRRVRELGVEPALFEQPTPAGDWDELARVAQHVTVAADENVVTAEDALVAARLGRPHVINVKIMKAGIVEALDVMSVARATGMGLMIGGNVESILAMTVSAALAGGAGGFSHVDLDTPLFFAENPFQGGFALSGAQITLSDAPGHGVMPA
jgi:L-alanine-DL-glutamate epimerase-like enolase superfamily enzyme